MQALTISNTETHARKFTGWIKMLDLMWKALTGLPWVRLQKQGRPLDLAWRHQAVSDKGTGILERHPLKGKSLLTELQD